MINFETDLIKLDQLLKAVNIVLSGGEAKTVILDKKVKVNGETETRRGRKLKKGDKISFMGEDILII